MASAGSIFVDLLLRDGKFTEGTKRAKKNLATIGKEAEDFARKFGVAIGAATVAIGAFTARQSKIIDDTVKLSRSLGVLNENFQALSTLADEAGIEQQKLGNLITRGQRATVEAAQGLQTYARAFDSLGLNVNDLINLRPDEQFQKIAEALSEIENPTIRNATALQIFGRAGRDVVNLLEDFSANLDEAREFNDRFGISVSSIDARKVEEANDTFARLGKALGGIGNQISIYVSPLVTELSNRFLDSGISGAGAARDIAAAFELLGGAIDFVRKTLIGLEFGFVKIIQGFSEFKLSVLEVRESIASFENDLLGTSKSQVDLSNIRQEILDTGGVAEASGQKIEKLISDVEKFKTTSQKIAEIQEQAQRRAEQRESSGINVAAPISDSFVENATEAKKAQQDLARLYEKNKQIITGLDNATFQYSETLAELNELAKAGLITDEQRADALDNLREKLFENKDATDEWADQIEASSKRAAENIQDAFADFLFDPFQDGLKGMLRGFVDVLRRMAAEQAAASIFQSVGGSSGLGGIFGSLFGSSSNNLSQSIGFAQYGADSYGPFQGFFADGGYIPPGTWGIAGEAGAEAIYGGRSGMTVVPQDKMGGSNVYNIDARGADQGAVARIEQSLIALAGPGVIERRVINAQQRGAL